jgi:hypothetical protein
MPTMPLPGGGELVAGCSFGGWRGRLAAWVIGAFPTLLHPTEREGNPPGKAGLR